MLILLFFLSILAPSTLIWQNTRTGLRTQLPWLPDGNSSCKDSRVVVTSGVNDTIPVFDDEDDRDDAMTQTCALDRWAESLPHIDSDVSDDDDDGYCCHDTHEYAKALVLPASSTTSGLDQTHSGVQPENIVQPKENESTIKGKFFFLSIIVRVSNSDLAFLLFYPVDLEILRTFKIWRLERKKT